MQRQIYATSRDLVKPTIVQVVSRYVPLRRTGKGCRGRCPFHGGKNPSAFSVSEEKGKFHCFACGESGDVIRFVELIESIPFKEALAELGMDTARPRRARRDDTLVIEARRLACWANEMTHRAEYMLREIGAEIYFCSVARWEPYTDKKLIAEHERALIRQWAILEDIAEDLQDENCVLELYRQRETIENILSEGLTDG